jgi:hypothetical protein
MLATALAVCACHQGRRVRFTTLAALANELQEAQGNRELERVIGRYARTELLVCDLCRYRDYADTVVAGGLNAPGWLGFSAMAPSAVSA